MRNKSICRVEFRDGVRFQPNQKIIILPNPNPTLALRTLAGRHNDAAVDYGRCLRRRTVQFSRLRAGPSLPLGQCFSKSGSRAGDENWVAKYVFIIIVIGSARSGPVTDTQYRHLYI